MSLLNQTEVQTLQVNNLFINGQYINTSGALIGNSITTRLTTQVIINEQTKNQALYANILTLEGEISGNVNPNLVVVDARLTALESNVSILQGNVVFLQSEIDIINDNVANINANITSLNANTQYLHAPYNGLGGNTSYFTNGLQVWNGGTESGNGIFSYVDGATPQNQVRLSVQNAKTIFLDGGSTLIAPTSGGNVNITGSGGTSPYTFNVSNPGLINANIRMQGDIELTGNGNSSISIFTQPASLIPPSPATDYVNIRGGNQAQILGPAINVAADSSLNLQAGSGGTVSIGTPSTGSTNSTINIGTNQGATNTGYQVITIGSGGVLQARNSSTFLEGDNYLPYVAATNTGLWDGIAYVGLPTTYSGPLHGPIKTTYTPYVKSISCFFAGVTVNSFISSGGSFTVGMGIGSINLTCGAGGFLCSTGAGLLALTTGIGAIALTTAGGAITATTGGGALQFSLGAGSFTSTTGVGIQRLETGAADIQIAAGYAASGSSGSVVITAKSNISIDPDVGLYLEKVSHMATLNNLSTPPGLPNYSLYTVNGNLYYNGTIISGSGGGVSQIIAGNGITVSPIGGTGIVTVAAIGSVVPPGGYLPVIGGNMVGDIYMKNTASSQASHIYQGDGAGQVKLYRPMSSYQAPFPSIGPPTYTGELLCFYNGDNNAPTQSNFTGWFPQSLVSAQPDFMTQLITGPSATVYSLANTSTPSPYDNTSCVAFPTFTNGVHITGGTVYISQIETTKPLKLSFGYPDSTPFYTTTFAAGSFPSTGLFTFTLDYTHTLSTGTYTAYWDNSNSNFSLMVANPLIKTNWCGTLLAGTASYYLMVFNGASTSQIFKWFPGQNTTEKVFILDGTVYGIQEQMIGIRHLYFYGLFNNITQAGMTGRVNNIFIYNVDTTVLQILSAETALQQNPPLGTNGAVYGVEVDTFNDRTWFWGDFDYVGTDYLGNPTPPRNDIVLKCGCDFTTTADWQLPVMFQGINGYRNCRGGKLLNWSGASYSLMVWAAEQSDGNNPPSFLPFNNIGMNYYQSGTFVWTTANGNCMSGGSISQPVANIQRISNAGGSGNHRLFFTGSFNNGVAYPSSNTCLSIMYSDGDAGVDSAVGQYLSELYEAYNSSDTAFWVDNSIQISVSNVRKMTNDVFVMNTNGYGLTNGGGVLALQSVDQTGALPTKYNITGMTRYSTKFIGGNDATKILLTCSLNQNNFFYSQTFDSTPIPTPTDPTVIAINGAKFLVDNTPMNKIVFAGSNQDYSSVSFIAGKVEDNDYNWYWQSQVGALDYYAGNVLYSNITSSGSVGGGLNYIAGQNITITGNVISVSDPLTANLDLATVAITGNGFNNEINMTLDFTGLSVLNTVSNDNSKLDELQLVLTDFTNNRISSYQAFTGIAFEDLGGNMVSNFRREDLTFSDTVLNNLTNINSTQVQIQNTGASQSIRLENITDPQLILQNSNNNFTITKSGFDTNINQTVDGNINFSTNNIFSITTQNAVEIGTPQRRQLSVVFEILNTGTLSSLNSFPSPSGIIQSPNFTVPTVDTQPTSFEFAVSYEDGMNGNSTVSVQLIEDDSGTETQLNGQNFNTGSGLTTYVMSISGVNINPSPTKFYFFRLSVPYPTTGTSYYGTISDGISLYCIALGTKLEEVSDPIEYFNVYGNCFLQDNILIHATQTIANPANTLFYTQYDYNQIQLIGPGQNTQLGISQIFLNYGIFRNFMDSTYVQLTRTDRIEGSSLSNNGLGIYHAYGLFNRQLDFKADVGVRIQDLIAPYKQSYLDYGVLTLDKSDPYPKIVFNKTASTTPPSTVISTISTFAKDSAGTQFEWSRIQTQTENVSSGNQDGTLQIWNLVNGTLNQTFSFNGAQNENNSFRPLDLNGNDLRSTTGNVIINSNISTGTGQVLIQTKGGTLGSGAGLVISGNTMTSTTAGAHMGHHMCITLPDPTTGLPRVYKIALLNP